MRCVCGHEESEHSATEIDGSWGPETLFVCLVLLGLPGECDCCDYEAAP